ncbi:hypothetical protein [Acinetobacter sp. 226-4]|uniref:hypothetical protein n=1 Tax=Acinetobacter sp. 226-4 TaxID=2746719 RepID=UPI002578B308|nr:hypothetical protein [Acinetobacter sp. 226-4]MDM1769805.1 hypothetical protein [Acinetobacter sp. 226-4]
MKKIVFIFMFVIVTLAGCQKQFEEANAAENNQDLSTIINQFEEADAKINQFLDQLDDPNTPIEIKAKILCIDYPNVYNQQYAPALFKISPKKHPPDRLDRDLIISMDYYKNKLHIQCEKYI